MCMYGIINYFRLSNPVSLILCYSFCSVNKNTRQAQQSIGYCPQFDALCGSLTGREHLVLFSKLRGIPTAEIPAAVGEAIKMLELTPHADKPVSAYSGGNARRLSTAIALVGDPPVVMLVRYTLRVHYVATVYTVFSNTTCSKSGPI